MTAVLQNTQRCLIWFGHCPSSTRQVLAAEGWSTREQPDHLRLAVGLRSQDHVALLLDLRNMPTEALPVLLSCIANYPQLQCLCLLPEGDGQNHRYWLPLTRRCALVLHAPLQNEQLALSLQTLLDTPQPRNDNGLDALVGQSPPMLDTRTMVRKYAPVDLPVLITGQTGTGKELAAHALHHLSQRSKRPIVAINCGAIPSTLVQSELFGHERGAFTGANSRREGLFEHANGGTVFLDEVGDLPADAQTALLRVLQQGTLERVGSHTPIKVDVRVLAATHINLEQAVAEGRFRNDLYYRLNVLRLNLPPLCDRGHDINLLAEHALEDFRRRHPCRARGFSPACITAMQQWRWPGNVRELINRIQRAAILCEQELIGPQDMELTLSSNEGNGSAPGGLLDDARRQAEREALLACLRHNHGNISATARQMKVARITIYRLCRRHGLDPSSIQA